MIGKAYVVGHSQVLEFSHGSKKSEEVKKYNTHEFIRAYSLLSNSICIERLWKINIAEKLSKKFQKKIGNEKRTQGERKKEKD